MVKVDWKPLTKTLMESGSGMPQAITKVPAPYEFDLCYELTLKVKFLQCN